jgi:hypothetical protein
MIAGGRARAVWRLGLLLALAASPMAGCSVIREDVGQPLRVDENELEMAEDFHAVLRRYGPPHRVSVGDAGMVFLYEEIDLFEKQLGINLSYKNVALVKAVSGQGAATRRLLVAFFDPEGRTQAIHYEERPDAAARGAALQFIFAVAGVVDDDDLSEPPAVHDWGFGLLEADLPIALNRAQQIDLGNYGLQQQATPVAIGQRTLELRPR